MTPEDFNKWRIWPRLLTGGFSLFFFYAWFYVVDWFISFNWETVENQAVALALAGFPAAILTVITIVLGKLIDKYMNGPST
jgi:hypothetical protein